MTVLRPELLSGRSVVLVGDGDGVIAAALAGLGASVLGTADGDTAPNALVYDARPAFGEGGEEGLRVALGHAWEAISDAANVLIPAGEPAKIVLIGPRPDAGALAEAARAALENLARTLSVEWARYAITTTMVAPGTRTSEGELSELVCFLVSFAGEYLSGCRFELGAVGE